MSVAFIGLGSNLGDRVGNIQKAIGEISKLGYVSTVSSLYETEPVGVENQPDFINCVIKLEISLSPYGLLVSLQSIEKGLGRERERREKWEPRTIDLDIIFYDDLVIETHGLTIPHPRAHLRRFVLEPLCEIAPDFIHPTLKVTVSKLLEGLANSERVVKVGSL